KAMADVIAEANSTLSKAPGYAGKVTSPIYNLPAYLLIGPEGSGKTSVFLNSGLEPQSLAGQTKSAGGAVSTRFFSIWIAKNAIFIELSGRAFNGDLAGWTKLLLALRGTQHLPWWRRFWGKAEQRLA